MLEWKWRKGDYGDEVALEYQFLQADGVTPQPLGTHSVKFKLWNQGTPGTLLIDKSCTVVTALTGIVKYTPASGDLDIAVGAYLAEFQLETGAVGSSEAISVTIEESPT